jgi:hypothetical protein
MSDDSNNIDLRKEIEARKKQEAEAYPPKDPPTSGEDDGISDQFILDCLNCNVLGDAILFARSQEGRFCYFQENDMWE